MICSPCKRGADYLDIAKYATLSPGDITIAKMEHEQCHGCDCQHRVELQAAGKSVK